MYCFFKYISCAAVYVLIKNLLHFYCFLNFVLLVFQAHTTEWTSVLSMNRGAWTQMCVSIWTNCVMVSLTALMAGMRGLTAEVINTQWHAHTSDKPPFSARHSRIIQLHHFFSLSSLSHRDKSVGLCCSQPASSIFSSHPKLPSLTNSLY